MIQANGPTKKESVEPTDTTVKIGKREILALDHGDGIVEVTGRWSKFMKMDDYVAKNAKLEGCSVLLYTGERDDEMLIKLISHESLPFEAVTEKLKEAGLNVTKSSRYDLAFDVMAAEDIDTGVNAIRSLIDSSKFSGYFS